MREQGISVPQLFKKGSLVGAWMGWGLAALINYGLPRSYNQTFWVTMQPWVREKLKRAPARITTFWIVGFTKFGQSQPTLHFQSMCFHI